MEQTSVILRGVVESDCPLLLFNNPLQIVDIGAGGHFRGKGGDVAFEELARLQDLKGADVAVQKTFFFVFVFFRNTHHINARTLADIHRALQLQHQQCLTHDGTTYAVLLSNITLGRQTGTYGIVPLDNLRP